MIHGFELHGRGRHMGLSFGQELRFLFAMFYPRESLNDLHEFLTEWEVLSTEEQHDLLSSARAEMDVMIREIGVVLLSTHMIHGDRQIVNPIGILNSGDA